MPLPASTQSQIPRAKYQLPFYNSCSDFPRSVATSWRSRSLLSASNVALITLCGLAVPIDLVSTFCTPTEVITARTAPPAITPVPSGAGLSSTRPDPKVPSTACGIEGLLRSEEPTSELQSP